MDQTKIWDFFQNNEEADDVFAGARPRYGFLAKQVVPGAHILNIGVGRGGLESILLKGGAVVSCLDPSETAIDGIRKQYELGERAQVGFSQAIPFADSQFDFVVMSEVLEHLSDDVLNLTLVEVRRVLKPGGHFIGTVPANEILSDNRTVCPHCGEDFHRWGHVQSFSLARLREVLLANNFAVIRNETRAFPDWRSRGLQNIILNLMRYVMGRVGSNLVSHNIYFDSRKN